MTRSLQLDNPRLLCELEPFVMAVPEGLARFDRSPFGLSIAPDAQIDPLRIASAPFLDMLVRLDRLTFGTEGMPMPRWLFVDGAGQPGGIVGLGRRAARMSARARELMQVPPDWDGVVPWAMYIAIPTFLSGEWMGHNLASLNALLPEENLAGLGAATKAIGLKVFRATRQIGVTQWRHQAVRVHARLGPLALLSAWTPAHSDPASFTYQVAIDDAVLRHLARDRDGAVARPPVDFWVDSADEEGLRALQARIEAGERFCVAAPPVPIGPLAAERQRVPIARLR